MVQLILNPAYLPIADVSEIGLFGEILSDESVGVLIQPFLPRMVGAAKISLRFQCFDYFGVLVKFFAIVQVMVCTLALCAFNTLMAARTVSSALRLFNLQMMV